MGAKFSYKTLVESFVADPVSASEGLADALATKELKPEDFSIARLFEECYGWEAFKRCRNKEEMASDVILKEMASRGVMPQHVKYSEATGAVTTSHFQNISGQIIYSAVLEGYNREEFKFTPLINEIKATQLHGEKMAGITEMGDEIVVRAETEPYALAGLGENWVFTPPIKDRGVIVPLTWEVIFEDRTGQLVERARNVGYWAGVNKEKRAIDAVIDENTTDHRYNWRSGGQIATYGDNSGAHTWDNLVGTNPLVDHTDIDNLLQAFHNLTDPFTGEPITVEPIHLIAVRALDLTVRRILNSTMISTAIGGYATSGNLARMDQANPFLNAFTHVTSRLLASRLATDTDWFMGNITAAVVYMWAEQINVIQAPPNNQDEFHRRIVQQHRVNERGQHFVREPRAMAKSTAA